MELNEVARRGQIAYRRMIRAIKYKSLPSTIYFWNAEWCKYNEMIKEGKYD